MPDNINADLNNALTAYTDIFYLLTPEQQKKHKNEIDKYFACNEIGAASFDDFLKPLSDSESEFCVCCPKSAKHRVVKNGKDRDGRQRYFCKDCGKTFYAVQDSLSSNVNQDMNTWIKFVRGMFRQYSLDELSEDCNISRTTALSWRLRVFQALEILSSKVKLSGNIIADDTRLNYNLKGNHGTNFIMPHRARSRGGSYSMKSHNKNQICILCAIDENGNSFSKVVGFGNPSAKRICDGFKDKIDCSEKGNYLITDGANCFNKAIETYGFLEWKKRTTLKKGNKRVPDTTTEYHIQRINSYHSRLKRFIRNYNGISSRYLPGYLLLFDYLQNNKDIDDTTLCREILSTMATAPKLSKKELENKYIPPVSNRHDEELWELKVSHYEQKIYFDWTRHKPINEIVRRYKIKRRKIYSIKEKVERYNLHDTIIDKFTNSLRDKSKKKNLPPISEHNWQIFIRYYSHGVCAKQLADEFNTTPHTIYNVVQKIKYRPEAAKIPKFSRKTNPPVKVKPDCVERNYIIYQEYKFLKSIAKKQKDVYVKLAVKHNLSAETVKNIVEFIRAHDPTAEYRYRCAVERRTMPPEEYYMFLQNRNRVLVSDVDMYLKLNLNSNKKQALKAIAPLYNLSFDSAVRIYYHQSKYLYIYDHYLEKHGITLPQAQVQEQEPLPQGP
ncbi:MAG: IS1595 family transposase [Clostridia bacterium]|nr:IS1595 family transposase [Clostridia bacterium]